MVIHNQAELERQGGIGYWNLCDGRFDVWDRGDGIAEVSPSGAVGVTTQEMADSCKVFDKSFGRSHISIPVGFSISAPVVGLVHGEQQPDQDETGYLETASAFPGYFRIAGHANNILVETVDALEAILVSHTS